MAEKLILTASAIRSTKVDSEGIATRITKELAERGHINFVGKESKLNGFLGKRVFTPLLSKYSATQTAIANAIDDAISFEVKRRAAISTYHTKWTEPANGVDAILEFFYESDFRDKIAGKLSLYKDHPYTDRLEHAYRAPNYYENKDQIETYDLSAISDDIYESIMAKVLKVIPVYAVDSPSSDEAVEVVLERLVIDSIRSLNYTLGKDLRSRIECIED